MTHKLLLVDDSVTIQKVVELLLSEEGFEVKITNNGEEALEALSLFTPDIVLADIEMPGINGYQLCEKIKMNPDTRHVPVILLAGAFEPIDEVSASKAGADEHLVKPFESQELLTKIHTAIEKSELAVVAALKNKAPEPPELEEVSEEITAPPAQLPQLELLSKEEIAEIFRKAIEEKIPSVPVVLPQIEVPSREEFEAVFRKAVEEKVPDMPLVLPEIELPSKKEFAEVFKQAVDERLPSMLSDLEIKNALLLSVTSAIKGSVEQILRELAPEIIWKLVNELLEKTLPALTKETEKVIWQAVPSVAEIIISKEIAKIKAGM